MTETTEIKSLYAWVFTSAEGKQGMPSHCTHIDGNEIILPIVGMTPKHLQSIAPVVGAMVDGVHLTLRLCRFDLAADNLSASDPMKH